MISSLITMIATVHRMYMVRKLSVNEEDNENV